MEASGSLLCHEEEPCVSAALSPDPCSFSVHFKGTDPETLLQCSYCSSIEKDQFFQNFFQNYLQREHRYLSLNGYVERLGASADLCNARVRGVQWMILAGLKLCLRHKTIFAAVNYLDRFLSADHQSRKWEEWMVELISIACLSIASKLEEVCHPTFDEYQKIKDFKSDRMFDPRIIKQMELLVVKVLDWQLNCVTPFSYIELLSGRLSAALMQRITHLLIHTLCDFRFLEHNPSVVAVSVLKYTVKEISFAFLEALISEECRARIDICTKMIEGQIGEM